MKVKFNETTLNIENESKNPRKEFEANWNYFSIRIIKTKRGWENHTVSPLGETLIDNTVYKIVKEALQDSFNNIQLDIAQKKQELKLRYYDKELQFWYGDI